MKIKEISPKVWNFSVVGGVDAWQEVAYSARMSGVPQSIAGEEIFTMILENDYGSALEHVIVKFDLKMSKGNAPEMLEHRLASHSGFSTRYIDAVKSSNYGNGTSISEALPLEFKEEETFEIIIPGQIIAAHRNGAEEKSKLVEAAKKSIEAYQNMIQNGVPREAARYVLPFCKAVGIYHYTINLRSLLNFLGLRLCVRASAEMRCIASQMYFALEQEMPILKGLIGCRGFMRGVCPESGVTGVRVGKPLTYYPACPFRAKESRVYIPTRGEFTDSGRPGGFDREASLEIRELLYRQWAKWENAS